ncbi:MAG: cyclodeaminase/cyclohydrolase family protein [Gaiellaceae bacterium]
MAFQEMSLAELGEVLASSAPTPGGGSASAVSGALAAALVGMVARLTTGEKFAERAGEMQAVAAEADRLRSELLSLADEDAAAFDQVMDAFRMPKETPEQQSARSQAIQQGYKAAVEPPLRVCERSLRLLELVVAVAERGNPTAVSDAGVAALLATTGLEGAALNVRINLGSIKDEGLRSSLAEHVRVARARSEALRETALEAVRAKLG